jgi:hypothetical protein
MLAEIRELADDLGERGYDLTPVYMVLSEIAPCWPPCYVIYSDKLSEMHPEGKEARGGYTMSNTNPPFGVILLSHNLPKDIAVFVLIHEYAHHLSQQNHDFLMYELWYSYLLEEFLRRWNNAERKEDTDADRRRHVVVRKVCI